MKECGGREKLMGRKREPIQSKNDKGTR